jgi:hypothetical protein
MPILTTKLTSAVQNEFILTVVLELRRLFFSSCSWTAELWRWRDCGLSKRRELFTQRHRVTFQKSSILATSLWERQFSQPHSIFWSTNYEAKCFVISDEYLHYVSGVPVSSLLFCMSVELLHCKNNIDWRSSRSGWWGRNFWPERQEVTERCR